MKNGNEISELSTAELENVTAGLSLAQAYAIASALGALAIASYQAGYALGKDLAE